MEYSNLINNSPGWNPGTLPGGEGVAFERASRRGEARSRHRRRLERGSSFDDFRISISGWRIIAALSKDEF